jgi:hypothetical protein
VGLVGGGVPAGIADMPCEPPECTVVTHGLMFSPLVSVVDAGNAVEWRTPAGTHWLIESGTSGGCLGFKLEQDDPYRAFFIIDNDELYVAHTLPTGGVEIEQCRNAFSLPNGMMALRYSCGLHAREGGFGLLLVSPE